MAIMTLEKLLALFMDKGKQVRTVFSGSETGTEICNRRNCPGPMGTRFVTSARDTHSTACGCQKGCIKILQPLCSPEDDLYHHRDSCFQLEMAGSVRRGVTPQEKEPGRGRVRC